MVKGIVDVSRVVGMQEPTALQQLVDRLRVAGYLQELRQDIQMHAHVCLRMACATDVAVCLEACSQTCEAEKQVQLHFHAFLKSEGPDLRVR